VSERPVCDYEGSDYQSSFWDSGGREYEDRAEAIALRRLLPPAGILLLELGAGAGRNTPRYRGFEHVVLLDYSLTQLEQAQQRLGASDRYTYVAADVNRLPIRDGAVDVATMIRTLHHMSDAPYALKQVRDTLRPGGHLVLEFANKLNLKAIVRYLFGRQNWSPFTLDPIEFESLNFDFHPSAVRKWLRSLDFHIERTLAVSHFRLQALKNRIPASILAALDGVLQPTGALWQLTPSVFMRARRGGRRTDRLAAGVLAEHSRDPLRWLKCPNCSSEPLQQDASGLVCLSCGRTWPVRDGIFDFRLRP